MRLATTIAGILLLAVSAATYGERYDQFRQKFAQGPHMKVTGATFFGTEATEEFVSAVHLPDGPIVAIGNSWGPTFPAEPKPVVWGKGKHTGGEVVQKDRRGRENVRYTDATAGMLVFYTPDLTQVKKVIRLDWGVGRFEDGCLASDAKSFYIAGVAGPSFGSLPGTTKGEKGDVFLMRIVGDKLQWVKPVGIQGSVKRIFARPDGGVYLIGLVMTEEIDRRGRKRRSIQESLIEVKPDGSHAELMRKRPAHKGGFLAVDPKDGSIYFGGDRNTNTGREPWRQPFVYKYDREDNKQATLYEYPSKRLRDGKSPGQGQVSDSSIHKMAFAPNGDMVMIGWSDGGNSILSSHPQDVSKPNGGSGLGMSLWGANVSSFSWIIRCDRKSYDVKAWSNWASYLPKQFSKRDKPNACRIDQVAFLADTSIAITGGTATGLVPTPNAFWVRPESYGGKSGGKYVAVLRPDMTNAMFSSHLPGYDRTAIAPSANGLIVVGRVQKEQTLGDKPVTPPSHDKAPQRAFGGGHRDAHLILLTSPGDQ